MLVWNWTAINDDDYVEIHSKSLKSLKWTLVQTYSIFLIFIARTLFNENNLRAFDTDHVTVDSNVYATNFSCGRHIAADIQSSSAVRDRILLARGSDFSSTCEKDETRRRSDSQIQVKLHD
jgi:hypothetical protein